MNASAIMEQEDFKKCVEFHGHVCGGLAIGYTAAKAGMDWLESHRALDEELVSVVETDACCVDAIQVLTGCTFGKGNLLYRDYGKMSFSFFNRTTGKGVRLAMKHSSFQVNPRQIELFAKARNGNITDEERVELEEIGAQRTAELLETPADKLFDFNEITEQMPDKARIAPSKPCTRCGEPTMETKLKMVGEDLFCRGCLDS